MGLLATETSLKARIDTAASEQCSCPFRLVLEVPIYESCLFLPQHEIHYLTDADAEYQSANHTYILFEYTTDHWPTTIQLLNVADISHQIQTDSYDLQYILI